MKTYKFDVKAFFCIEVEADSEGEARKKVDHFDGADVQLGQHTVTLAFDGEYDLLEDEDDDI